jgi:4-amino-4-deoxy-L-arabinose transferase-like glycosyltransferase
MAEDPGTSEELPAAPEPAAGSAPASEPREAPSAAVVPAPEPEPAPELDDEAVAPDPNERKARRLLPFAAFALAVASFFGMIARSGIWEPHELKVADLSRRIAVGLFGATNLASAGENIVPTAPDLGRGELPFTSVALGLKLFGLSEWAGRLPMALWGLAGAVATFWLLSRLVDRATASFAVIVLATMPLYFLQARTILGDIVAMASLAVATAGLAVAVFDPRLSTAFRFASWLVGGAGMAGGYGARGVLIGVVVPSLAIGLAWLVRRDPSRRDRIADVLGGLALALGAAAAFIGLRVLLRAEDHQYSRLIGATIEMRRQVLTHDVIVHQLGHALLPWSALLPFALGRLLRPPLATGDEFERESSARVVIIAVAALSFGVYTGLAPLTGALPYGGVFALAAAAALFFRDLERGAPASRSLGLGVVSLLVLFYTDYKNFPEKGLAAFVVEDAKFPESFKELAKRVLQVGLVVSGGLFMLFLFERDLGQPAFVKRDYQTWPRTLKSLAKGNVLFALIGLEVAFVGLAIALAISDHHFHFPFIETMALPMRLVSKFGFVVLPLLVVSPYAALAARDAARFLLRALKITRGAAALGALTAFGAAMSFVYYPALARQISPKEVYDSYQRLARPGEPLGMIGATTTTGSARYYARGDVRVFTSASDAFNWLTGEGDSRRFLISRSNDIGQLNSLYRGRRKPPQNLPVLDARSSEILLVSNRLLPGETNENPFAQWLPEERPKPQRGIDVDFNGQLHAFGWAVTDRDGQPVGWVRAGKPYQLRLYYEVTKPISGEWQTFVHIDGYQRRFNGDHETLEGKYAFHLWKPGDYVVDIHPIELEPNFTAGTYTVFFGLFRGDQRLEVKRGGASENRVNAGPLEVR